MPKKPFEPLAEELLQKLEGKDEIADFLKPVDWKKIGLVDYPKVVKHPMSIQDIRAKLKKSKYTSFDDFFKDVSLIWQNCRDYNEKRSLIVANANKLGALCKAFYKENVSLPKKRRNPEPESEESKGNSELEQAENDSEAASFPEQKNSANNLNVVVNVVKVEDLLKLKEKVMSCSIKAMSEILSFVKKRARESIKYDGDNVTITLERLNYQTFKDLCDLVKAIQPPVFLN